MGSASNEPPTRPRSGKRAAQRDPERSIGADVPEATPDAEPLTQTGTSDDQPADGADAPRSEPPELDGEGEDRQRGRVAADPQSVARRRDKRQLTDRAPNREDATALVEEPALDADAQLQEVRQKAHDAQRRAEEEKAAQEEAQGAKTRAMEEKEAVRLAEERALVAHTELQAARQHAQEAQRRAEEEKAAREQAETEAQEAKIRAEEEKAAREQADIEVQEAQIRAEEEKAAREQAVAEAQEAREILQSARQAQDVARAGISRKFALYDQWQGSSHRALARGQLWTFVAIALAFVLTATALLIVAGLAPWPWLFPGIIASLCIVGALAAATVGIHTYNEHLASYLREREFVPADAAHSGSRDDDRDLDELLRLNRAQMQAYQSLSRGQQRSSFRSSLAALFVGLSVLVVGIVLTVQVSGDASKIAVAGVAAIGSALSGYIASTYLALHGQAGDQLRYFADQPIITSYIYEAERLAQRFAEGPARAKVYEQVVQDILEIAQRAQAEALTTATAHAPKRPTARRPKTPKSAPE
jgi:chemotaxis protein histidine kinase CheA